MVLKEQTLTHWDTYLHGHCEGSHTSKDALRHQSHVYVGASQAHMKQSGG